MPVDVEWSPAKVAISACRRWMFGSLANRITAAAPGLALAVALVLSVASFVALRYLVELRITSELEQDVREVEIELRSGLNAISRDLAGLASNSLVANGLVDSMGRDTYLLPLLREHRLPVGVPVQLVLCDYQGRFIASSANGPASFQPLSAGVERAIASAAAGASLLREGDAVLLQLYFPVVFPPTGSTEGALVGQVDLGAVLAGAMRGGQASSSVALTAGGEPLLHLGDSAASVVKDAATPVAALAPLDELSLQLRLGRDASVFAPVRRIGVVFLLIGGAVTFLVSIAARRGALRLTRRISKLSEVAREAALGGKAGLLVSPEGRDEVETVAEVFGEALSRLEANRQSLEQAVRDRTAELEQRTQELRQSQKQLAVAVEGSRLATWAWDLTTGEVTYSGLLPGLVGIAEEDLDPPRPRWTELIHPEDGGRVRQEVIDHLKGCTASLDTQYRVRTTDGRWKWVHTRGQVVERSPTGRAIHAAGTHADVTWRREAEEQLRAAALKNARLVTELQVSEERLRLALASGIHVEWELDVVAERFSHGNRWAEMLAVRPEEVDTSLAGWQRTLHPEDRARATAALQACIEGPLDVYACQYRVQAGGGWKWLRSQGRVVARDAAGRATCLIGTRTDVTEVEDLQARLLAATRLASVGTLAAGVAHEINNPLTYVVGNLMEALGQLRAVGGADARASALLEDLEGARVGAERIAAIVKSMQSLGRPERPDDSRDVDVRSELLDSIQLTRNQLVCRARLEVSIESDLPKARARTSELGRVFLNLLVNAAQAIPEGDVPGNLISVKARRQQETILVEISDTGAGIPTELRSRIFEAFFTTKPVGEGTGLGLTLAKSIVDSVGGTLDFESVPGQFTTFRVRLPVAQATVVEARATQRTAPDVPPESHRVLLIDDEPMVRRSVERMLKPRFAVMSLGSAEEGLEAIRAGGRWDAVLCDFMMAGLDGVGFYERLAAEHPDLVSRLAFVTGGAYGDRAQRFLDEHQVTIIPKPVFREELLEVVERLAGARSS